MCAHTYLTVVRVRYYQLLLRLADDDPLRLIIALTEHLSKKFRTSLITEYFSWFYILSTS
eukprot:245866-Prorocentrum_minimum.AAC.4